MGRIPRGLVDQRKLKYTCRTDRIDFEGMGTCGYEERNVDDRNILEICQNRQMRILQWCTKFHDSAKYFTILLAHKKFKFSKRNVAPESGYNTVNHGVTLS